ncbi:MAG: polysaccharide pyruvyl transferase family protein [Spirochaetales bacterium]|nr:polysaccharide pyruvyl transferase family protein [Spirochaetales bacterium]
MKVACITFHDSLNYGAVLQTYGLQTKIKSLGVEYKIIDYSTSEKRKFDSILGRNKELSSKRYLLKVLTSPYKIVKKIKFAIFTNRYLDITCKKIKNSYELKRLEDRFDYFICGSDQVWNLKMIRYDSAYFLSFISKKEKKISYASSIGRTDYDDEDVKTIKKYLEDFEKISVREKSGVEFLSDFCEKQAKLVLDPTLLLSKKEWADLKFDSKKNHTSYILTYCLSYNDDLRKFITNLQNKVNMPVIGISSNLVMMFREKTYAQPSPKEFVHLFLNATYVVTNSFHGTAFSVNFNKPFFSFVKGDLYSETNSRIVDFLEMVNLKKHLYNKCPDDIDITYPDFSEANEIIEKKRLESILFLKESIGN